MVFEQVRFGIINPEHIQSWSEINGTGWKCDQATNLTSTSASASGVHQPRSERDGTGSVMRLLALPLLQAIKQHRPKLATTRLQLPGGGRFLVFILAAALKLFRISNSVFSTFVFGLRLLWKLVATVA